MKALITPIALLLCLSSLSAYAAVIIGPGATHTAPSVDGPGDRLNIDRTFEFLPAATYGITEWQMNVADHTRGTGGAGTVTPMLLELTNPSPREYMVLWLGNAFDPTSNGVQTPATYPLGAETFTITAPLTSVYAGFFTQDGGAQIVPFGGGTTDHDGAFTAPTSAGDSITGISNTNLGRSYAFEITVDAITAIRAIPEPSTFAYIVMAVGGFSVRRYLHHYRV